MFRRDRHSVVAAERVGPYTLLRVERGGLEPGVPGQFFMLEAPGRVLPRPMSLSLAPPGELGFLFEAIGPGTNALAELEPGDRIELEVDGLGRLAVGVKDELKRTWARETRLEREQKGLKGYTPQLTGKYTKSQG